MKRWLFPLGLVTMLAVWSSTGFAQPPRQQIVGPPPPVNTTFERKRCDVWRGHDQRNEYRDLGGSQWQQYLYQ